MGTWSGYQRDRTSWYSSQAPKQANRAPPARMDRSVEANAEEEEIDKDRGKDYCLGYEIIGKIGTA